MSFINLNIMKIVKSSVFYEIVSLICIYANIIHTHQEIMNLEKPWHVLYPASHICFLLIEGFLIYILSFIWPKKRHLLLIILYYLFTIILWINIAYNRYFDSYMPLTLYGEFNNLEGLLPDIINSFKFNDLFFVFTSSIITFSYKIKKEISPVRKSIILPLFILFTIILTFTHHYNGVRKDYNSIAEFFKDIDDKRTTWDIFIDRRNMLANNEPKTCTYYYGITLSLIWEELDEFFNSERYIFSEQDKKEILKHHTPSIYNLNIDSTHNIIFILVESLSSFPLNKTFGGVEITPNLNRLINDAYFNPNMTSEAKLGQSSDGQFIYLTGLLPLKAGITINSIKAKKISSFVSLAKINNKIFSQMIIPTGENEWSQKSMCKKYGIDTLYSIKDYKEEVLKDDWMNDKQLFEFASIKDDQLSSPFISFIITSSMHSPYTKSCENYGIKYPADFSPEVKHYLDNVHYMDKYLGKYIQTLEHRPWYQNCTIIISADHKPNGPKLNTNNISQFESIPLIIINPPLCIKGIKDNRSIMQTSVFPTILDMLQIKTEWRGVGRSIFMPDSLCNNEYENKRFQLREMISNYIISKRYLNHSTQDNDTIINWMY